MPLKVFLQGDMTPCRERLRNVSRSGLCFQSAIPLSQDDYVHLLIPVLDQQFEADAAVVWRRPSSAGYEIGVRFLDPDVQFAVRMVEQLCHSEAYRQEVLREEGRELSSEAAAEEWVARFAASFPPPGLTWGPTTETITVTMGPGKIDALLGNHRPVGGAGDNGLLRCTLLAVVQGCRNTQ